MLRVLYVCLTSVLRLCCKNGIVLFVVGWGKVFWTVLQIVDYEPVAWNEKGACF